jgi:hypothetical protein
MQSVIIGYFLLTQPHVVVVEISPKLKGTRLGAPKLSRPSLKKWGIEKALYLADQRGDQVFIDYINNQEILAARSKKLGTNVKLKLDDDTDNYIQIEAFCVEAGYQLTKTKDAKPKYRGPPKLIPVARSKRPTSSSETSSRLETISSIE